MDTETEFPKLLSLLEKFETQSSSRTHYAVEKELALIIKPLFEGSGYTLKYEETPRDIGIDFTAERLSDDEFSEQTIGIELLCRGSGRKVSSADVKRLLGSAIVGGLDKAVLVTNTGFSAAALSILSSEIPINLELLTLQDLRAWIESLSPSSDAEKEVELILERVSAKLASLIAENPEALRYLEWRDIERTMAEVFSGIGFQVTLTPPSKDGGKDLILECVVHGSDKVFYVEVKHWRSKSRVGGAALKDFLKVLVREKVESGVFLSTYGYCDKAFEQLTSIERSRLRFGAEEKIVSLCRSYVKRKAGIWSPPKVLTEVLFEKTV